ncbi:MAG: FAD-linked oxidase C-terminal domain-containing protein [Bacteroidota bacterium]
MQKDHLRSSIPPWSALASRLSGELHRDEAHRILYATDASVYRELPVAVAFPRSEADLVACVQFAAQHNIPLTPRAGGTSLAGQAVGTGLIVDVSRHLRTIHEINLEEGYAIVDPGVIRDQLNDALRPHGYWFGPNTSTANRCTLGGMFGNNSCGSTSITVGSTREHVLEASVVLSDGSTATIRARPQVQSKDYDNPLLRKIYTHLDEVLTNPDLRQKIHQAYPKPTVTRRNTGYALDLLARQQPYTPEGPLQNLCTLLAGSEGTLAVTTRLKVRILPVPPSGRALAALHYPTVDAALRATQAVMEAAPFMCELMDDTILQLARQNPEQRKNAAFVQDTPRALLMVEFRAETNEQAVGKANAAVRALAQDHYAAPILRGAQAADRAWKLRAAGLGILGNMVGDAKAVACIEDTAVALPDLADYIDDVGKLMEFYGQDAVYYAHAGAGEIHLRPVLNLKTTKDREDFYAITRDVARLVKKYGGSLSGEHGDGRVRAAFLPELLGPEVYQLLVDLKRVWDPQNILNPGKIVQAPPMNESLRYEADVATPDYPTLLDFSADGGLLRAAEKCNGSGDCRKMTGGAMCPSYRALTSEQHSTRGRANTLREVLTRNQKEDPFQHPALAEALDLCLSCKACTAECPSSVDMTNLKAEYLHQRGKHGLRTRLIAANEYLYGIGGKVPTLANAGLRLAGPLLKRVAGIAAERSLPAFPQKSFRRWFKSYRQQPTDNKEVYLFGDEFTNLQDPQTGVAAVRLLNRLGYRVHWPPHRTSGRAQLSKGLLPAAGQRAAFNVGLLYPLVSAERPVVGLEPSALLSFRDEYPKLLRDEAVEQARQLAHHVYTLDEFLHREFQAGRVTPNQFGGQQKNLVLHVHCHEKALGDAAKCAAALSLPPNFHVTLLDSGCCGMAGSFGYEKEHFALSKTIAEQSLLWYLRDLPEDTLLVANGTSCRHQIKDFLGIKTISTAQALLKSWT